jgi:hypothetical protein
MSGFEDPFSGFFSIPVILFCIWMGILAACMVAIFFGFDNGGFLHRLEERFGIFRSTKEDQEETISIKDF